MRTTTAIVLGVIGVVAWAGGAVAHEPRPWAPPSGAPHRPPAVRPPLLPPGPPPQLQNILEQQRQQQHMQGPQRTPAAATGEARDGAEAETPVEGRTASPDVPAGPTVTGEPKPPRPGSPTTHRAASAAASGSEDPVRLSEEICDALEDSTPFTEVVDTVDALDKIDKDLRDAEREADRQREEQRRREDEELMRVFEEELRPALEEELRRQEQLTIDAAIHPAPERREQAERELYNQFLESAQREAYERRRQQIEEAARRMEEQAQRARDDARWVFENLASAALTMAGAPTAVKVGWTFFCGVTSPDAKTPTDAAIAGGGAVVKDYLAGRATEKIARSFTPFGEKIIERIPSEPLSMLYDKTIEGQPIVATPAHGGERPAADASTGPARPETPRDGMTLSEARATIGERMTEAQAREERRSAAYGGPSLDSVGSTQVIP